MYRYKLILKHNWYWLVLTGLTILAVVLWTDNINWIIKQTTGGN